MVPVLEGTTDDVLAAGYGHFADTAEPGRVGNYALAAHRITHGEPLRRMPDLEVGDEVVVETRDATYTYRADQRRRRADGAVHRRLGGGRAAGQPRAGRRGAGSRRPASG